MSYKSYKFYLVLAVLFAAAVFAGGVVFAQRAPSPAPAVYLFWTADTYTPSDYQGKALPVYDSWITVNALVSNANADKFIYYWWVNDFFQKEASGLGKKFYRRHIDIIPSGSDIFVKVLIDDPERKINRMEASVIITTSGPQVGLYQYNSAAKKISSEIRDEYDAKFGEQVGFIAKPFFFSVQKISDLVFKWLPEGGSEIESKKDDANILGLKIPESPDLDALESDLTLSVENPFSAIQKETAKVILNIKR